MAIGRVQVGRRGQFDFEASSHLFQFGFSSLVNFATSGIFSELCYKISSSRMTLWPGYLMFG